MSCDLSHGVRDGRPGRPWQMRHDMSCDLSHGARDGRPGRPKFVLPAASVSETVGIWKLISHGTSLTRPHGGQASWTPTADL